MGNERSCGGGHDWHWQRGVANNWCRQGDNWGGRRVKWRVVAHLGLECVTANIGGLADNLVANLLVADNCVASLDCLQDCGWRGNSVHCWRLRNQVLAVDGGQSWHGRVTGHVSNGGHCAFWFTFEAVKLKKWDGNDVISVCAGRLLIAFLGSVSVAIFIGSGEHLPAATGTAA